MGRRADPEGPWICKRRDGFVVARARGRQAAMNIVDRPYTPGRYAVQHAGTGETWERRRGSWIKTDPGGDLTAGAERRP